MVKNLSFAPNRQHYKSLYNLQYGLKKDPDRSRGKFNKGLVAWDKKHDTRRYLSCYRMETRSAPINYRVQDCMKVRADDSDYSIYSMSNFKLKFKANLMRSHLNYKRECSNGCRE